MLCPFVEKLVNLSFIYVGTNQNTTKTTNQKNKRQTDQPLNDNNRKIDKSSTKNI